MGLAYARRTVASNGFFKNLKSKVLSMLNAKFCKGTTSASKRTQIPVVTENQAMSKIFSKKCGLEVFCRLSHAKIMS